MANTTQGSDRTGPENLFRYGGDAAELALFRDLIDSSSDAIFIVDPRTARVRYANQRSCANLGYSPDELLQMRVLDFGANVPDERSWENHLQRMRRDGQVTFETRQRRKDGSTFPVEVNAKLVRLDDREFLVSLARDISERKAAEEALLAEKAKLEAVLTGLGDGVTLQDTDLRILYQNQAHIARQGAHVGEYCYCAYQRRQEPCDGCLVLRCFEDGQIHRRETSAATDQGHLHMEVVAIPLRDENGRIYAGIEVVRDITERKALEGEFLKAQKLESLGLLAGGIAHDFNNLLTSILGSVSLVKLALDPELPACRRLEQVEQAVARAQNLTQQLLTFSRGGEPLKKALDLERVLREAVTFALHGSNVECIFRFAPDLWSVDGDEGQLSQVFNNLLINALQAMPNGGTIRISGENLQAAEAYPGGTAGVPCVVVNIADQGTGILPENLPRIFDPYFTTKEGGSGLGLAASYSIVNRHGGRIAVDSLPEAGTTFTLYFPALPGRRPEAAQDALSVEPGAGRVLVMDDMEMVREVAVEMLRVLGYQVDCAADGAEAVSLFVAAREAGQPYDVVILDLTVPGGMGGREAVRALLECDPAAKVVVSSGYSGDRVLANYSDYGFAGVVAKPYRVEELGAVVARLCRHG